MKYEIGQKVTTPLGVGEIIDVFTREDKTIKEYKVCINTYSAWVDVEDIKPYKTPHERLIEMDYEYKEHKQGHRYIHKEDKDYIDIDLFRDCFYHFDFGSNKTPRPMGTSLKLARILTDYLELLEEEK